jgi:STE24 endopeptidase
VTLLATDAAGRLVAVATAWTPRPWLQLALVLAALAAGWRVLSLPLRWLGGFWLPRRFGLLHQSLAHWMGDALKAAAIGAVLALAGAELAYALLRLTPWWWLYAALAFFAASVLLTLVAPIWLVPLFYRLTPLPDGSLRRRLVALAARADVPVLGVWVGDQSRKSRTANAAVTGLGRTRRIILFDTLLAEFSEDEVEAVLAHELAHHAHAASPFTAWSSSPRAGWPIAPWPWGRRDSAWPARTTSPRFPCWAWSSSEPGWSRCP